MTATPSPSHASPADLSLSRSATARDAARRREPGLLERLAADPATRLVLVDPRGRVALAMHDIGPDLPDDGLTPPDRPATRGRANTPAGAPASSSGAADGWERPSSATTPRLAPVTAAELDLTGLTLLYLGRDLPDGGSAHGGAPRSGAVGSPEGAGPGASPGAGAWGGGAEPAALTAAPRDLPAVPTTTPPDPAPAAWLGVVVPADLDEGHDAEGVSRVHADLAALLEVHPLASLRATGVLLDAHDAGLATAAAALAAWHARAPRCPACGSRTEMAEAGWSRRCPACGAVHFPRTDPAVIMAVTDEADRIVLVHGATWPVGRYSTVAGFIEAGESAEAAVAREVAEEVGLVVDQVEYVASQPWPFPRSLMLGFRARLAPGQVSARPDGEEVTDAVVLSRDELVEAIAAGRVAVPGSTSIARLLIEDWFGGPVPD